MSADVARIEDQAEKAGEDYQRYKEKIASLTEKFQRLKYPDDGKQTSPEEMCEVQNEQSGAHKKKHDAYKKLVKCNLELTKLLRFMTRETANEYNSLRETASLVVQQIRFYMTFDCCEEGCPMCDIHSCANYACEII